MNINNMIKGEFVGLAVEVYEFGGGNIRLNIDGIPVNILYSKKSSSLEFDIEHDDIMLNIK
jgi:hypothetical protein